MATAAMEIPDSALYLSDEIKRTSSNVLTRSLNVIGRWIDADSSDLIEGYNRDWRGLAMVMKFDNMDIKIWGTKQNKASEIIMKWAGEQEDSTIGHLLDLLLKLRFIGLLSNSNFIEALMDDVTASKKREEERRRQDEEQAQRRMEEQRRRENMLSQPEQESQSLQQRRPDWFSSDARYHYVINDNIAIRTFDALICYATQDILFVKKMLKRLEEAPFDLNLCVDERDFLVGAGIFTLTAKIMEERCKRIVLLMSPDFVTTPMCEFQTEYALSLSPGSASKKILPVMYRTCNVPSGLKHIAGLYYTKDELKEWFWPRLGGSLGAYLQWNIEEDHQRPDWGSISMPLSQSTSINKAIILSSQPSRRRPNASSSSSSSCIPISSSSNRSGSSSFGLSKSDSSSSIASSTSASSQQGIVKVEVVHSSKESNATTGQLSAATASPVGKSVNGKDVKTSNKHSAIQEETERTTQVQVHASVDEDRTGNQATSDHLVAEMCISGGGNMDQVTGAATLGVVEQQNKLHCDEGGSEGKTTTETAIHPLSASYVAGEDNTEEIDSLKSEAASLLKMTNAPSASTQDPSSTELVGGKFPEKDKPQGQEPKNKDKKVKNLVKRFLHRKKDKAS